MAKYTYYCSKRLATSKALNTCYLYDFRLTPPFFFYLLLSSSYRTMMTSYSVDYTSSPRATGPWRGLSTMLQELVFSPSIGQIMWHMQVIGFILTTHTQSSVQYNVTHRASGTGIIISLPELVWNIHEGIIWGLKVWLYIICMITDDNVKRMDGLSM